MYDTFSATVYEIGGDEQLSNEVRETVGAKDGWAVEKLPTPDDWRGTSRDRFSVLLICVTSDASYRRTLDFLKHQRSKLPATMVVYDRLDSIQLLELFRAGAVECLGRPLNLTRLSLVLDMVGAPMKARRGPSASHEADLAWRDQLSGLDEATIDQVGHVAGLDTIVVITGETGTGKTRLSRIIHELSPRKQRPFLAVNCGAISESLLDSELFGHVKGAFTGADHNYLGRLAQCADGTLLLDEIDSLSPAAQVRLLQVVEDRVFQPVGSTEMRPLEARLIVASNKSLDEEVNAGRFRADLYYRLNVITFHLPPLRDRPQQVIDLAEQFSETFSRHHGFEVPSMMPLARFALESYGWPGNIRELRNVMERAVILAAGKTIEPAHLPPGMLRVLDGPAAERTTDTTTNKLADARVRAEREQLLQALSRNQNNRSKTALDLGISRVALYKRLRKFHIL